MQETSRRSFSERASGYGGLTVSVTTPHRRQMSDPSPPPSKRGLLLKLTVLIVIVLAGAVLLLRGVNLREGLDRIFALIRGVGPFWFFTCMALLPACGFPLLAFSLSAGPIFSSQLGLPTVIALVALSITVNLALTYWLARYALRPLLEGLLRKFGYQVPQVSPENYLSLTVLVRVTPGPPFFAQSYLLGLAEIPFRIYMLVSWSITVAYAIAVIIFGDSLVKGQGKIALLGFSLVVVMGVLVQWMRRRVSKKKV
jgi:uncharacterized membrane protein YdjX (TVP38/TMEM64 family)